MHCVRRGRNIDGLNVVAYSFAVKFSRRRQQSILRTILSLLGLVWALLPLHHRNVAVAGAGSSRSMEIRSGHVLSRPAAVFGRERTWHCHQTVDNARQGDAVVPCIHLGRVGPDLRPSRVIDATSVILRWNASWLDHTLRPITLSGMRRAVEDRSRRYRPPHRQQAILLI